MTNLGGKKLIIIFKNRHETASCYFSAKPAALKALQDKGNKTEGIGVQGIRYGMENAQIKPQAFPTTKKRGTVPPRAPQSRSFFFIFQSKCPAATSMPGGTMIKLSSNSSRNILWRMLHCPSNSPISIRTALAKGRIFSFDSSMS